MIIIPRANNSGFSHTDYTEGAPQRFHLKGASGERWFRFGSRATNPTDQWPDPDIYVHAASGQKLSGSETRNPEPGLSGACGRDADGKSGIRHCAIDKTGKGSR